MCPLALCCACQGERGVNLASQIGWHCRAEDKGSRAIYQILFQRAATAYKCAHASQCLTASVDDGKHFTFEAKLCSDSPSSCAANPGCERFVEHQSDAV